MQAVAVRSRRHIRWVAPLFALILVTCSFLIQGNIGLEMRDEGYLWYGTIRTAAGDIPMRDFRSYDPGRYYWAAAWSLVLGQGIMALRLSVALLQVIGLTFGLLAASRVVRSWWELGLVGLLLLVWMYPRYKLFEHSVTMAGVYVAVCLLEKPIPKRHFFAGVFVGLAAFVGRNHGLYALSSFAALILFARIKQKRGKLLRRLGVWLAGIIVGYAPMLSMFLLLPGMLDFYLTEKVLIFVQRGAANLRKPVPWPWTLGHAQLGLANFVTGSLFILVPLFYAVMLLWLFAGRPSNAHHRSLLMASAFVGIPYLHHAFSRPDLPHLAESIHPFLLGAVALLCTRSPRPYKRLATSLAAPILACLIAVPAVRSSPYVVKLMAPHQYVPYNLSGDLLWIEERQATHIEAISQFVARHASPHESLFIAPHAPAMYAILQRKAPVHNTYMLFPETEDKQEKMIQDLASNKVNWAILADTTVDRRDDLRFRNTHPLVWHYLVTEFEPIEAPGLGRPWQVFRRTEPLY